MRRPSRAWWALTALVAALVGALAAPAAASAAGSGAHAPGHHHHSNLVQMQHNQVLA